MIRVASDKCSRNFASVIFSTLSPYLRIRFFTRSGALFTSGEALLLFREPWKASRKAERSHRPALLPKPLRRENLDAVHHFGNLNPQPWNRRRGAAHPPSPAGPCLTPSAFRTFALEPSGSHKVADPNRP